MMSKFFQKVFSRFVVFNLLAMFLVVLLLCVGVKYRLDAYTHHGEGIIVPHLKGMGYEKAYRLLEEKGLVIQVSDSGYNKQMPADCILAQTPGQGQRVKQGHIIYVTVNSPSSPTFAIPDIVDNSSAREAVARLTALGFKLLPAQQVEGEKDWVYGLLCRGRRVSNGDRIPIDDPLTLLVGKGTYEDSELMYDDADFAPVTGEEDDFQEVTEPPVNE